MGLKIKVDGVEQETHWHKGEAKINENPEQHNSEFERGMDNDTKEMLWQVMDENTKLKTELMMANAKLDQIRKMLSNG